MKKENKSDTSEWHATPSTLKIQSNEDFRLKIMSRLKKVVKWAWLIFVPLVIVLSIYQHALLLAIWQGIALVWSLMLFQSEKMSDKLMVLLEKSSKLTEDMLDLLTTIAEKVKPEEKKLKVKHEKKSSQTKNKGADKGTTSRKTSGTS